MFRFFSAKDETFSIIRRELVADVFQNTLKCLAFYVSNSQAVKAELMRGFVDTGNHVVLYFANTWARQNPDGFYNYGNS